MIKYCHCGPGYRNNGVEFYLYTVHTHGCQLQSFLGSDYQMVRMHLKLSDHHLKRDCYKHSLL